MAFEVSLHWVVLEDQLMDLVDLRIQVDPKVLMLVDPLVLAWDCFVSQDAVELSLVVHSYMAVVDPEDHLVDLVV